MGTKIDHGNRMLGMDLVPRDENGAPLDPKKAGVMHLYKTVSDALSVVTNRVGTAVLPVLELVLYHAFLFCR